MNNPIEEARDRLTDRVLAEAIGNETPPDLSEPIAARLADAKATVATKTIQTRRAWIALLATAASLMIAVVAWRDVEDRFGERSIVMVDVEESVPGQSDEVIPPAETMVQDESLVEAKDRLPEVAPAETISPRAQVALQKHAGLEPGAGLDTLKLREAERRIGASGVFSTTPAQGTAPPISYKPSPELKRRLQARAAQLGDDLAPSGEADFADAESEELMIKESINGGGTPGRVDLSTAVTEEVRSRSGGMDRLRELGDVLSSDTRQNGIVSSAGTVPSAPRGERFQLLSERNPARAVGVDGRAVGRGYFADHFGARPSRESLSRDRYAPIHENEFIQPEGAAALSTFSVDVDTASYTGVRQYLLDSRRLPPADAVRIEELVNYFDYGYTAPAAESEDPFTAAMEVAACPWKPEHQLVRIGIKGREVHADKRPLSNLVFLVDVSGSMNQPNKLPLVVEGLKALTERLGENDRVAIVVYAGSQGLVLPSTSGTKKDEIRSALGRLQAGGSTAGGAGLKLAYEIAERHKIPGGVNRVVLCTDGDFNVGLTGTEELAKLVESRGKEQGIFLTVLGFGRGNLNDEMLEAISGCGDGHYAYIDSEREARRVLSRDLSGTLVTIAKDVKLQVEFNPAKVAAYRLIGYENRVMAAKDFNDDTKDAGEIGAGHTVTALYEVVPVGVKQPDPPVDGLKYQPTGAEPADIKAEPRPSGSDRGGPAEGEDAPASESLPASNELLTLKIRYKQPEGGSSKKLEFPLEAIDTDESRRSRLVSDDFRWAAAVAEFGMLLRHSRYAGEATFDSVLDTARGALGEDSQGYRAEFLDLVRRAKELNAK